MLLVKCDSFNVLMCRKIQSQNFQFFINSFYQYRQTLGFTRNKNVILFLLAVIAVYFHSLIVTYMFTIDGSVLEFLNYSASTYTNYERSTYITF